MSRLQKPTTASTAIVKEIPMLEQSSPKLDVHSNIRLFPHQQAIVHKLIEMEQKPRKKTFVGVLRDPPGSGKSFPLLAMILHEKRMFKKTQNLLVIPHNIHEQWLKYIKEFSSELNAISLMNFGQITSLNFEAGLLFEFDIFITTSTFYPMIASTLKDLQTEMNRVILDEIDSISFFTSSEIPSKSVWLVSASAQLTKDGFYAEHAQKNAIMCDPLFIKRSINLQPPIVTPHACGNEFVQILQQDVVKDIKAVYANDFTKFKFTYLRNEYITNPKELLSAIFRDKCIALLSTIESIVLLERGIKYQTYLNDPYTKKVNKREKLKADITNIINLTVRRKCPFCCDNFAEKKSRVRTPCCTTTICRECMVDWLLKIQKCPRCCEPLKEEALLDDKDDVAPVPPRSNERDKMEQFEEILKKEVQRENFRILIFSDYAGTFLRVNDILDKHNLSHAGIEGNQYTMNKAISDYQTGNKPILLVDSQAYGAGMNMEMTTAVIIMHKTERQEQVIGRAQRLGRTSQLHIHHLNYPGEFA